MTSEYDTRRRLGYKIPRSTLLPPYLELNPYYAEYTDGIDQVWTELHDNGAKALQNIRNPWVTSVELEQKVVAHEDMIELPDWAIQERETLVKQVNMLGMKLKSAGVLTDQNYQTVSRYLGMYWRGKGTQAFIDFIDFCLDTTLTVRKFWAEIGPVADAYNNMTLEPTPGEPPGVPMWEGGTWFPTTHVAIEAVNGSLGHVDHNTLVQFFYEIANYNLVLQSITNVFYMPIVDDPNEDPITGTASIVAVALYRIHQVLISNLGQFGADPPSHRFIDGVPVQALGVGAYNTATSVVMGRPDGWFLDTSGRTLPLYYQNPNPLTVADDLPLQTYGDPLTPNEEAPISYQLLMGPVQWVTVPGFPNSKQRVPVWTAQPTTISTQNAITTRMIGNRDAFLTNPRGWYQIQPGMFTPFW